MAPQKMARLLKAARMLVGMTVSDLADKAGVSRSTLLKLEKGDLSVSMLALQRAVECLEEEGVLFLSERQGATGPGVCLREGKKLPSQSGVDDD